MVEAIVYDTEEIVIPVKFRGTDYVLHEASEETSVAFRNAQARGLVMGPEGNVERVTDPLTPEPLLVSRCITDAGGKLVARSVIHGWPARFVKTLYDKIIEISDMETEDVTDESLEEQLAAIQKKIDERDAKALAAKNEDTDSTTTTE